MFNLTCDSILKYTAHVILTMLVILNIVYPNNLLHCGDNIAILLQH